MVNPWIAINSIDPLNQLQNWTVPESIAKPICCMGRINISLCCMLIAEQAEQLVGFLFAIPDFLQIQRNRSTSGASDRGASRRASINTIVIKTVAGLPGRTYAGLGNLLVSEAQSIAHHLGYRRVIHALMHDANTSRNLSGRYAIPIRRYTLFCKPLAK
jgi:hypothetical protein